MLYIMMYRMKKIINLDDEITFPKCMYAIKNPNEILNDVDDINISNQVMKFLKAPNTKMAELEQRQDLLLKKLDVLYDRIKAISSYCSQTSTSNAAKRVNTAVPAPAEIVVVLHPDNLPWFIKIFLKESSLGFNMMWHIHSSIPNEKVPKINAFVKKLKIEERNVKCNLRLIFRSGSADNELKMSPLSVPIMGNVNILRYLACLYPSVLPYDWDDYNVDSLLDLCHQLERSPEKSREAIIKKIFAQHKDWIYKNEFSIVDVAVYNVVKQWQNGAKYVPKSWYDKCENKFS